MTYLIFNLYREISFIIINSSSDSSTNSNSSKSILLLEANKEDIKSFKQKRKCKLVWHNSKNKRKEIVIKKSLRHWAEHGMCIIK